MSNRFIFFVAGLCLAVTSFAEVRWGQVELAFFRIRGEDGRMVDLPTKGIVLPVRMERINARHASQARLPVSDPNTPVFPQASLVYKNDLGSNYFFPGGPSALDDINILPSGNGQWWSDLTLGVHTEHGNSVKVMNRQLGWTTFVSGRGAGVQAFDNLVFDVGWVFQPGQFPIGTWKYTIPIQQYWAGIPNNNKPRVPSGLIYFAQEWRAYNLFGNGAFLEEDFSPVFSGDGEPTVGSSLDAFWYDWDPTDGIFTETEQDWYDGPPNQANFLMELNVAQAGVTDVVRPISVQLVRGKYVSGNVGGFHFVDQNYYRATRGLTMNAQESPLQIVIEGFSPSAGLTGISLDVNSQVNTPGLQQVLELFNYTQNKWVVVDQRAATTVDTQVTVGAPGAPAEYIDPNGNVVKMKISFKQVGIVTQSNWGCRIDLGNWLATHP